MIKKHSIANNEDNIYNCTDSTRPINSLRSTYAWIRKGTRLELAARIVSALTDCFMLTIRWTSLLMERWAVNTDFSTRWLWKTIAT